MRDKLVMLPGGGQVSEIRECNRQLREIKEGLVEYYAIHAELIRAKYDELVKQGFTEAQTIELCKTL